jgi:hypothetical protein
MDLNLKPVKRDRNISDGFSENERLTIKESLYEGNTF